MLFGFGWQISTENKTDCLASVPLELYALCSNKGRITSVQTGPVRVFVHLC